MTPNSPTVFNQVNDYSSWGTVLFATGNSGGLTTQSGTDGAVRSQFMGFGQFADSNDIDQPHAINDNYPVFASSDAFGSVGTTPTKPFTLLLGYICGSVIDCLGNGVSSLWRQYWRAYENMLAYACDDAMAAASRACASIAAAAGLRRYRTDRTISNADRVRYLLAPAIACSGVGPVAGTVRAARSGLDLSECEWAQ